MADSIRPANSTSPPLLARHGRSASSKLGRSCVLRPYRTKPVVELLWQGIWNYVRAYRLDVMIGCAASREPIQIVMPSR